MTSSCAWEASMRETQAGSPTSIIKKQAIAERPNLRNPTASSLTGIAPNSKLLPELTIVDINARLHRPKTNQQENVIKLREARRLSVPSSKAAQLLTPSSSAAPKTFSRPLLPRYVCRWREAGSRALFLSGWLLLSCARKRVSAIGGALEPSREGFAGRGGGSNRREAQKSRHEGLGAEQRPESRSVVFLLK